MRRQNPTEPPTSKKTARYHVLKTKGACVTCGSYQRRADRVQCADCAIKSSWAAIKSSADIEGYAPIAMPKEEFLAWYKDRLTKCNGVCEWCEEPFDARGPNADHDHVSGMPRALVCTTCNFAEGAGYERLRKIVAALDLWYEGKTQTSKVDASKFRTQSIELCFDRWIQSVNGPRTGDRDARIGKVVDEMRSRCRTDDEFDSCYKKFSNLLWERTYASR